MAKWNVTRSATHFEYAEVEAESYDEAVRMANNLDEEEWETNPNDTEDWIYEAVECDND